jgi:hypothetical protein
MAIAKSGHAIHIMIYYVYNPPRAIKIVRKESKPKKTKEPFKSLPSTSLQSDAKVFMYF